MIAVNSCSLTAEFLNIDGLTTLLQIYSVSTVKFYGQAERAISNGQLNALLRLHIRPIDVVVFHGPSKLSLGRSHLGEGFALICIQRLS